MLKTELNVDKQHWYSARHDVVCDGCGKSYDSSAKNVVVGREKYDKDLCRGCRQKLMYADGKRKSHFVDYNRSNRGKTIEERLGEEKGKAFRKTMSKVTSGENNANFGGKHSRGFKDRPLSGSFDEIYGTERSKEIRRKLSIACTGSRNPMFGRPSPSGSGNGWCGWIDGIFFRSVLELSYIVYMIDNDIEFENAEQRKYRVEYVAHNGAERNYFPDFYLTESKEVIEVKPAHLTNSKANVAKFDAAKHKYGDKFRIITEYDIHRLTTDEIAILRNSRRLKFIDRYEKKWKEQYGTDFRRM